MLAKSMNAICIQPLLATREEPKLPGATLFHEEWWLDAATNGHWDCATIERNGAVIASMPFILRNRLGLRFLTMPPYTRTLGPVFTDVPTKPSKKLSAQVGLLRTLLTKIPKHDRFEMMLPPESDLTLAFVTCSYVVTNTFTFVSEGACPSTDPLLRDMEPRTRRKILSSARKLQVERHTDVDRFIRMSVLEHGRLFTNNNNFPAINNIFRACLERNRAMVLSAVNEHGKDVAVSVLVWGCGVLYNLLAARHPEQAGPGANSLLVWEALRIAKEKGLRFDSDGVYSPHAAVFYSRFGLTPKVRPTVNLGNNWWKLAFLAKAALRPHSMDLYYRR
jgi:Acetyltransferase (GNAT) domain